MNKAKSLLDSLMGSARDKSAKDKTGEEFREKDVCKHFLVGMCPDKQFGKLLQKDRNPLEHRPFMPAPCELNHSVAYKADFENHPKTESFRREYEDGLLKRLEEIVADVDRMIVIGRPKCKQTQKYMRAIGDPRIAAQYEIFKEEKVKLNSEVVKRGEAGDVQGAQDASEKIKECLRQIEIIEEKHSVDFPGEECCLVCGFRYVKGQRKQDMNTEISSYVWEDDHLNGREQIEGNKGHLAYTQIRELLETMRKKKEDRRLEKKEDKDSRDRDGKDRDGQSRPSGDDHKQPTGGSRRDSRERAGDRSRGGAADRSRSRGGRDDRGGGGRDSDRRGRDDDRRRGRSSDKGNDRGRDRGGRRDDGNRDYDRSRRSDYDRRGNRDR